MYKEDFTAPSLFVAIDLMRDIEKRAYVLPDQGPAATPPESRDESRALALQTIDAMRTAHADEPELMFAYDPQTHPDLRLTLKRMCRAMDQIPCEYFPFVSWVIRVYADRAVVLEALPCMAALLVSDRGHLVPELFLSLQLFVCTADHEVAGNALDFLGRVFTAQREWRSGFLQNTGLLGHILGFLSIETESLLGPAFRFLRAIVTGAAEDSLKELISLDDLTQIVAASLELCVRPRTWLPDCLKLLYSLCRDDTAFDIAIQRGLERRVLELMKIVPGNCMKVLYQIICHILEVQMRFQCESLLTVDVVLFKRTARMLEQVAQSREEAVAKGKTLQHILRSIDIVATRCSDQLLRHGVVQACCELAEVFEFRSAKAICLTMSRIMEVAPIELRRQMAHYLISLMARMLDSDDSELVVAIVRILVLLYEGEPDYYAALFADAGVHESLAALCESDDPNLVRLADYTRQLFQ
jgi:hypothetical protein